MRYFASGSNHQGEIEGLAAVGMNVGVAAPELNEGGIGALISLPRHISVFVDSGAFSEVEFGAAGPFIAHRIEHDEWLARLGLYERLAGHLGAQLFAVAPDCVAHQEESLLRLERYAVEVRRIRALGANVIVPIQKGALSMADFDARACEILGFSDFVRGIPMAKDATKVGELVAFLVQRPQAQRVHLLGIGPKSKRWEDVRLSVMGARHDLDLSCDSGFLAALIGKANGPGGGPRAYTKAQEELWRDEIGPRAFCDDDHDYTDAIVGGLNDWAGPAARREIAAQLAACGLLPEEQKKGFLKDPQGWFHGPDDDGVERLNDWSVQILDQAWRSYFFGAVVVERKREAIIRMFPRGQLCLDL